MNTYEELMQDVQKAQNIDALDLVFKDVDHAKSSGQITNEEYVDLCAYAYNP